MDTINEKDYIDLQAGRVKVISDSGEVIGTICCVHFHEHHATTNNQDHSHSEKEFTLEKRVLQRIDGLNEIDYQVLIDAIKLIRKHGGFPLKEAKEYVERILQINGWRKGANKHGVIVWSKETP